jgi:hypothetical protein
MKINSRNNIHGSYAMSPTPNFLFNFAPLSYGITITYYNNNIATILMFIFQFANLLHIFFFPPFFYNGKMKFHVAPMSLQMFINHKNKNQHALLMHTSFG